MAKFLLGKVLYKDIFAGYLEERPGGRASFAYDSHYIAGGHPAISYSLPVREEAYVNNYGLHPFFDNLVAEGWLAKLQSYALRSRGDASHFELLLAFGYDLAGAVSVIDQDSSNKSVAPLKMDNVANTDELRKIAIKNHVSLSGVQAKLAVVEENDIVRTPKFNELSTHIAKFSSGNLKGLVENEYLTMLAFQALLPDDAVAEVKIQESEKIGDFLLVKRFDRANDERLHFEEFNPLLGKFSNEEDKYEGAYKDMANFLFKADGCLPAQAYVLYRRILAGILLGNTDMHFKNFAMFHTENGLRLTPSYDQVAASLYEKFDEIALGIAGSKGHAINDLKPKHLCILGDEFSLSPEAINLAVGGLEKRIEAASDAINEAPKGHRGLKDNLIKLMRKRWNGTFSSIGKTLSKRL